MEFPSNFDGRKAIKVARYKVFRMFKKYGIIFFGQEQLN